MGSRMKRQSRTFFDLIVADPGNYLKYYIGYVEFLELKKKWVEKKGEEFFPRKNFIRQYWM